MSDLLWTMFSGDAMVGCDSEDDEEGSHVPTLEDHINTAIDMFVGGIIPPRSIPWYRAEHTRASASHAQSHVNSHAGDQRSEEWFERRHNMITASNAWKMIGSEASQRSLIWEKIQPPRGSRSENVEGATHWGERYEDVAVALYERETGETVSLVGCVPHEQHSFIGASPDGIVVGAGRGLEIKCVVSRELTGVPTKAYWVQMQWQAEVLGLDEIDFLECKFSEYESREEADQDGSFTESLQGQPKGTMHQFHGPSGTTTCMHHWIYQRKSMTVGPSAS